MACNEPTGVEGRLQPLEPAILKPERLWTGKQVVRSAHLWDSRKHDRLPATSMPFWASPDDESMCWVLFGLNASFVHGALDLHSHPALGYSGLLLLAMILVLVRHARSRAKE